jgi:hypothetical protein
MAGSYAVGTVFAGESGNQPSSQLDNNFNQAQVALNTLQTFGNYYVDTGAANVITITVSSPQLVAIAAGLPLQIKVLHSVTGATTININALVAQALVNQDGSAIVSGQCPAGSIISIQYDGTNFQLLTPFPGLWGGIMTAQAFTPTGNLSGTSPGMYLNGGLLWLTGQYGSGTGLTFSTGGNIVSGTPTGGTTMVLQAHAGANALQFWDELGNVQDAGYRGIPQNIQNGNYTTVLADRGKHLYHTSGSAHTWTIDSNANVAYPIGTALSFINDGTGAVTIAITADTLVFSSAGTTGSRTLNQYAMATAVKVTSTRWFISGSGLL